MHSDNCMLKWLLFSNYFNSGDVVSSLLSKWENKYKINISIANGTSCELIMASECLNKYDNYAESKSTFLCFDTGDKLKRNCTDKNYIALRTKSVHP